VGGGRLRFDHIHRGHPGRRPGNQYARGCGAGTAMEFRYSYPSGEKGARRADEGAQRFGGNGGCGWKLSAPSSPALLPQGEKGARVAGAGARAGALPVTGSRIGSGMTALRGGRLRFDHIHRGHPGRRPGNQYARGCGGGTAMEFRYSYPSGEKVSRRADEGAQRFGGNGGCGWKLSAPSSPALLPPGEKGARVAGARVGALPGTGSRIKSGMTALGGGRLRFDHIHRGHPGRRPGNQYARRCGGGIGTGYKMEWGQVEGVREGGGGWLRRSG